MPSPTSTPCDGGSVAAEWRPSAPTAGVQAVTVLDRQALRSRVCGVVTKVYKHTGEGVKALEPVVQVRHE